jgi:hypothetical protein
MYFTTLHFSVSVVRHKIIIPLHFPSRDANFVAYVSVCDVSEKFARVCEMFCECFELETSRIKILMSLKTAVLWVVAPCSLVEVYHVSGVLAASIIRAMMMEPASTSETSAAIFILAVVRTSNLTLMALLWKVRRNKVLSHLFLLLPQTRRPEMF